MADYIDNFYNLHRRHSHGERILQIRPVGDGSGMAVITTIDPDDAYRTRPRGPCPGRRDAPLDAFPPQMFRDSATTYDQSTHPFGCRHDGIDDIHTHAGFLREPEPSDVLRPLVIDHFTMVLTGAADLRSGPRASADRSSAWSAMV